MRTRERRNVKSARGETVSLPASKRSSERRAINGADTDTFCETKTARAFSWEMKHVCYPHIQTFTGLECIVRYSSTGSLLHLPCGCTFFPPLIEDTTPSSPYSLLCLRISHHAVPQNHQYLLNGTHPQVGQRDEGVHKKQYAHISLLYPATYVHSGSAPPWGVSSELSTMYIRRGWNSQIS